MGVLNLQGFINKKIEIKKLIKYIIIYNNNERRQYYY